MSRRVGARSRPMEGEQTLSGRPPISAWLGLPAEHDAGLQNAAIVGLSKLT